MKLFGWTIIRTEYFNELNHARQALGRLYQAHRWLGAHAPLDVLWQYILRGHCDISDARTEFQEKARKHDWSIRA